MIPWPSTGAATAAAVLVVLAAWHRRPMPMPVLTAVDARSIGARKVGALEVVGGWVQARFGVATASPPRRVGGVLVAAVALVPVQPLLGAAVLGAGWLATWWITVSAGRRRLATVEADLAASTDLLAVALLSGCPFPVAVESVATLHRGAVAEGWRDVVHRVALGGTFDEELDTWGRSAGPHGGRLVETLLSARRSGAAVGPALRRLAADHRELARRRAEERARRLPVLLLLPLATCVLPAFALVAVVPVAIAGAGSIAFP